MNKLAKNYIYNLGYQIFVIIVPLITMPYLARVLHSDNLGIYSYVTSCASIINTIGLLGLYNYGDRQIAYTRDNTQEMSCSFNELMSIRLILCVLASLIYFVWALQSEYTVYFLIYYPWLLTGFIDISWFFAGIEDMGPMVFKNFLIKLLNVICIFLFVREETDLWKYFALIAIVTLIANLSMYSQLQGKGLKFRISFSNANKHIRDAILLFLPQLASVFYLQIDKVMLNYISGDASQVAFYDQAEKIVNIPFTVITALSVVMMPRIANEFKKGNHESIINYITKSARFAFLISLPMMFGLIAIAPIFVPWYLSREYLPVIKAIWIISPIILTNTLNNISGTQYLTAINKIGILTFANVLTAIMNVILNSILIPQMGFYGAAIATVISSMTCASIQLFYMNRTIKIFSILICMWRYLCSAVLMFLVLKLAATRMTTTIFSTVLLIVIGVVIYFLSLTCLKDEFFFGILKSMKKIIKTSKRKGEEENE